MVVNSDVPGAMPLADVLSALRKELAAAQMDGKGSQILFKTEKLELELRVQVATNTAARGDIKFWVIGAGGGAENRKDFSHLIKMTLSVVDGADNAVKVSSTSKNRISQQ